VQQPIWVILPCVLPEGATICDTPGRCGPSDTRARGTKKVRPTFASLISSMDKIFIHQWCRAAAWGSDTFKKSGISHSCLVIALAGLSRSHQDILNNPTLQYYSLIFCWDWPPRESDLTRSNNFNNSMIFFKHLA